MDTRNPEYHDVSEPMFLDEYQEAGESIEVIGHWCLCMVYASFKAYLGEFITAMSNDYRGGFEDLRRRLAAKKANSWFERYRQLFLEDLGIDTLYRRWSNLDFSQEVSRKSMVPIEFENLSD